MVKNNNIRGSQRLEEIYQIIRNRICLLEYAPGMRLKEMDLAKEFNVSRSPIRQVLARLQSDGLIKTRHGAGSFVTNIKTEELINVYELRIHIAELIGKLNPIPPVEGDIEDCEKLLKEIDQFEKKPCRKGYAQLVMNFHQLISKKTGNDMLRKIDDQLFYLTSRMWVSYSEPSDWSADILSIRFNSNQIIQSLKIGDSQGISLAYRNAIIVGKSQIIQHPASELHP